MPRSVVAGQQIPEGGMVEPVLVSMGADLAGLGVQCGQLAKALDDFAGEVARAQNAIRDLLNRLGSASGLWHEVVEFFDGDALDEIKEIAEDIRAVLHNLGREARAKEQAMQRGIGVVDGLVRGMQRYARGELQRFLGNEIGNPLATAFDFFTNLTEGVYKSAFLTAHGIDQLSPRLFLTDPQGAAAAWKGVAETGARSVPAYALLDPSGAGDTWSGLLHLDDWSRDRPGLGLGENLFDVGTLALGGVEVKGDGSGARGAGAADGEGVRAVEGADAGGLGSGAQLGDISKLGKASTARLENLGEDLPKADPPPSGNPVALPPAKPQGPPVEPRFPLPMLPIPRLMPWRRSCSGASCAATPAAVE
ncbi:hypothetical protein MB901379_02836 [Mycobacterium basiliense]|uniref:Uncharacterized protein n=1 Tax=Mycobacterium basiliense TaxID=2094119 RepID=A0A3S4DU66_9MYCO|nr:hypothetical protein [Mycobacterium basiliense]VDM89266.1 hypothetical protein MB901379_02836 [Mycobacterium basiliense]